jgi:hypothetical protein
MDWLAENDGLSIVAASSPDQTTDAADNRAATNVNLMYFMVISSD